MILGEAIFAALFMTITVILFLLVIMILLYAVVFMYKQIEKLR